MVAMMDADRLVWMDECSFNQSGLVCRSWMNVDKSSCHVNKSLNSDVPGGIERRLLLTSRSSAQEWDDVTELLAGNITTRESFAPDRQCNIPVWGRQFAGFAWERLSSVQDDVCRNG
jgi:hypothetical protein